MASGLPRSTGDAFPGHEQKNKVVFHLADLFHHVVLELRNAALKAVALVRRCWCILLRSIMSACPTNLKGAARNDGFRSSLREMPIISDLSDMMPRVLGLIGGIGSGKSAVAAAFARLGAVVIAGDQLGHEALKQPAIRRQIVEHFGPAVLDANGDIDRRRLAAIVFADDNERRALERGVHPYIEERIRQEIAKARANPAVPLIVLDAAILLEAGWHKVCDQLVYIDAPPDVRQQRLAGQRGWSAKQVQERTNAQWSLTDKRSRADFVLENSGTAAQLEQQVQELFRLCNVLEP